MPLYTYVFSNSMKVPEGQDHTYNGKPQVGVSGSSFYSLEPISKGVSINKKGNAVATDVGTYQVKAKIKDGFLWEITDPVTGDNSHLMLWIILMVGSLLALGNTLLLRRMYRNR